MSETKAWGPALRSLDGLLELATTASGGHPRLSSARLRLGVLLIGLGGAVAPTGCIRTCYKPAPPPEVEPSAGQEKEAAAPPAEEQAEEKEKEKEKEKSAEDATPAEAEAEPEQE